MKFNQIIAMSIVVATCITLFYNPMEFSRFEILAMILLAVINWNITEINYTNPEESEK